MTKRKDPKDFLKRGQPTKFRPEYCQKLKDFMSKGYSFLAFAAEVGVNQDTLYQWQKDQPSFSEAVKEANELSRRALETIMIGNATGKLKGNAAASIFLLKNRFPKQWRDRQEIDQTVTYKPVVIELDDGKQIKLASNNDDQTSSLSD